VGIPFHHLPYSLEFKHAPLQNFYRNTAINYQRTGQLCEGLCGQIFIKLLTNTLFEKWESV
jgi:hypothetical protein